MGAAARRVWECRLAGTARAVTTRPRLAAASQSWEGWQRWRIGRRGEPPQARDERGDLDAACKRCPYVNFMHQFRARDCPCRLVSDRSRPPSLHAPRQWPRGLSPPSCLATSPATTLIPPRTTSYPSLARRACLRPLDFRRCADWRPRTRESRRHRHRVQPACNQG